MATFVLVPGAGGDASFWSRLVPELHSRGHDAIPVDIREDDPALGLPDYAQVVIDAIGQRRDVVLVGHSLGAFTLPMVAAQVPVRMIVLLNLMIPLPGEAPEEWWGAVGAEPSRETAARAGGYPTAFDLETYFLHDISDEVRSELPRDQRAPADTPFGQPCEFASWPDVPIRVVAGRDDRFFPVELQRQVARDRLGVDIDVLPGGHLLALSRPRELADCLDALA